MIQGKTELRRLIEKGLVTGAVDMEKQLQVNGFELTAAEIHWFEMPAHSMIGFDNADRVLPTTRKMDWRDDGWLHLDPGCYKVIFNETIAIPLDMCAIARPRSSLLRMGATVETAVWDAGYKGRSEALLVVGDSNKWLSVKKDSRLVQLVFMRLESPAGEGYNGIYQGENPKAVQ